MKAAPQSSWPIVQVDSVQFTGILDLFRDLRMATAPIIRQMQPRICLQCWMIIGLEDAPSHKGHNQTSDFAQMEEATRASFLGLCKQYDRLTPDCKQVILMKVQPKITQFVEMYKKTQQNGKTNANGGQSNRKKGNQIQEVDLTNAISSKPAPQVNGKNKKQPQNMDNLVGKKRSNPDVAAPKQNGMYNTSQPVMPPGSPMNMPMNSDDQQKMMMQFPNMFNQFMMNAMQQNFNNQTGQGKNQKGGPQMQNQKIVEKISPQTEQFQIKMIDMVKKLQKKCEQISSEVKIIKQSLSKPNLGLGGEMQNKDKNSNENNGIAENNVQGEKNGNEEKKQIGASQEVIDLEAVSQEDKEQQQKLVDAELEKIREENRKQKDPEQPEVPPADAANASDKVVDDKVVENKPDGDQKMTGEESKEAQVIPEAEQVPKTPEQIAQEEKERKELIENREKMLQNLAGGDEMGMDFQEPMNSVDMPMDNTDKMADDALMAQQPLEPQTDQVDQKMQEQLQQQPQVTDQQVLNEEKPEQEKITEPLATEQPDAAVLEQNKEMTNTPIVQNQEMVPESSEKVDKIDESKQEEIIRQASSFGFGQFDQGAVENKQQEQVPLKIAEPVQELSDQIKESVPQIEVQQNVQAVEQQVQVVQEQVQVAQNQVPLIVQEQVVVDQNQQVQVEQPNEAMNQPAIDMSGEIIPSLNQVEAQQIYAPPISNVLAQVPDQNADAKTQDPAQSNYLSEIPNQAATSMTPEIDLENQNGNKVSQMVSNNPINPEERTGVLSATTVPAGGPEVIIQEQRRSQSEKLI